MNKIVKTITIILVVISVMFVFAGCRAANPNQQPGTQNRTGTQTQQESPYEDGTYTGKGDPWDYGSEDAIVEIANGKIKNITLRRLDKDGKEVDYETWTGQEVDGKKYPNLKQFRIDMANSMLDKQSYDVDTISGATVSTKNWKLAVQRALEEAKRKKS